MHYVGYALESLLFGFLFAAGPMSGVFLISGGWDSWLNYALPSAAGLAFGGWYFFMRATGRQIGTP